MPVEASTVYLAMGSEGSVCMVTLFWMFLPQMSGWLGRKGLIATVRLFLYFQAELMAFSLSSDEKFLFFSILKVPGLKFLGCFGTWVF